MDMKKAALSLIALNAHALAAAVPAVPNTRTVTLPLPVTAVTAVAAGVLGGTFSAATGAVVGNSIKVNAPPVPKLGALPIPARRLPFTGGLIPPLGVPNLRVSQLSLPPLSGSAPIPNLPGGLPGLPSVTIPPLPLICELDAAMISKGTSLAPGLPSLPSLNLSSVPATPMVKKPSTSVSSPYLVSSNPVAGVAGIPPSAAPSLPIPSAALPLPSGTGSPLSVVTGALEGPAGSALNPITGALGSVPGMGNAAAPVTNALGLVGQVAQNLLVVGVCFPVSPGPLFEEFQKDPVSLFAPSLPIPALVKRYLPEIGISPDLSFLVSNITKNIAVPGGVGVGAVTGGVLDVLNNIVSDFLFKLPVVHDPVPTFGALQLLFSINLYKFKDLESLASLPALQSAVSSIPADDLAFIKNLRASQDLTNFITTIMTLTDNLLTLPRNVANLMASVAALSLKNLGLAVPGL
ncbi:hypothetical protein K469DRAFT_762219 [Zopfia rhizophila CBS 207.26]|uniref:Uncharacterized protein n=1 Tax=Zopfia rhizophila CBS 207.26 TaxID=1314779 RepID=A0A6A6ECU7_9PEZI|nr:hypothetical protein K469DRAFT_762219 [Zopfia rhizophila CBS 207.26]